MLENLKLGIKEVIMLIGWVLSLAAMYYSMNARIDSLQARVGNHNFELLEYKLNQVNDKTDRVLLLLDGE